LLVGYHSARPGARPRAVTLKKCPPAAIRHKSNDASEPARLKPHNG
jgi:hypothetical protein